MHCLTTYCVEQTFWDNGVQGEDERTVSITTKIRLKPEVLNSSISWHKIVKLYLKDRQRPGKAGRLDERRLTLNVSGHAAG